MDLGVVASGAARRASGVLIGRSGLPAAGAVSPARIGLLVPGRVAGEERLAGGRAVWPARTTRRRRPVPLNETTRHPGGPSLGGEMCVDRTLILPPNAL
jgi:hypothetical protein